MQCEDNWHVALPVPYMQLKYLQQTLFDFLKDTIWYTSYIDTLNKSYPTTENPIIYRFHIPFSTFLYILYTIYGYVSMYKCWTFVWFPLEKEKIKKKFPHAHDVIDMLFALTHLKINAASSSWWNIQFFHFIQLERCTLFLAA